MLAASSSTTVTAAGKRGLAYNDASLTLAFNSSAVGWTYNWAQTQGSLNYNSALEFVPMLWSNASDLTSTWSSNAQAAINAGSKHLFSFNEPDLCAAGAGSSCMSLNSSLAGYKKYMQPFAGKALLGSPAVTNGVGTDSDPMGAEYLQQFIGNCTGCTIDFVNMHWYSNIYAGVNYLQSQVEAIRAVAGGRPIWLTEFGITTENAYTEAQLESFLQEAMEYLDSQPDVAAYAYFWAAPGVLINSAGTGVSSLGAMYNSYDAVVPTSNATSTTGSTSSVSSSTIQSSATLSLTAASSATATAPACPSASGAVYVDSHGATYNVYCSSDTTIGSYANASVSNGWTDCASLCDASSSCVAFVYKGISNGIGPGYCYFKNNVGNVFASTNTLVAGVLNSTDTLSVSSSASSVSSSTSTTISTSTRNPTTISTMTSTTSSMTSTTSSKAAASSASTKKINIISAFFARSNVTIDARQAFLSGNNLVIDSYMPGSKLGGNPWVGHPNKTLSILYTNGQDASQIYVFTAVQNSGTYTITPATVSSARKAPTIAAPQGASIEIVAVTFGNIQITDPAVFTKLYNHAKSGASFTINPTFFNANPMAGIQKTAVVWYKKNGVLKALTGYGGSSYTF